jgi:hypothetical protein
MSNFAYLFKIQYLVYKQYDYERDLNSNFIR